MTINLYFIDHISPSQQIPTTSGFGNFVSFFLFDLCIQFYFHLAEIPTKMFPKTSTESVMHDSTTFSVNQLTITNLSG
jgi:hypothetical protein